MEEPIVTLSNEAIRRYLACVNGGRAINAGMFVNIANREISIRENNFPPYRYSSDITFHDHIPSGFLYFEIGNDTLTSFLKQAIFWPTKYVFAFENDRLVFSMEERTISIC